MPMPNLLFFYGGKINKSSAVAEMGDRARAK